MKSIIVFFAMLMAVSGFNSEEKGSLNISLSNIKKEGQIKIAVYREGDGFPDAKFIVMKKSIDGAKDKCELQFESLSFGSYAIAIYQDVNGNGQLDKGMFGVPEEPFAFSNNFRPRFGGPSFERCKFNFAKNNQTIQIEMINSLFGGD